MSSEGIGIVRDDTPTPIADKMRRMRLAAEQEIDPFDEEDADDPRYPRIDGFMHERELAERTNRRLSTVRRWQRLGLFGPWIKIAGEKFCRADALERAANEKVAAAEAAASPPRRGRPRRTG